MARRPRRRALPSTRKRARFRATTPHAIAPIQRESPYTKPYDRRSKRLFRFRVRKVDKFKKLYSDARRFNQNDIALDTLGRRASITLANRTKRLSPYKGLQNRLKFRFPFRVEICQRRRQRRDTLFARHIIGRGRKGGSGARRMKPYSHVRC